MCQFQQLHCDSYGYVIRCNECRHYQILFKRTVLSLSEEEYRKFLTVIISYKQNTTTNSSQPNETILPTPRQGVHLLLTTQELGQLHYIIESADSESKALSLLHLFQ